MRIGNFYAGLGGNRKLWGDDVEVTAIEKNAEIAAIYQEYFPNDKVIVGDAHEYLLKHYKEFDFIWTSRPCQTHSRARQWAAKGGRYDAKYPDMSLYEEILFLEHYFEGKWVSENVKPYYEPLIRPTIELDRHLFWSNFKITPYRLADRISPWAVTSSTQAYGFDVSERKINHRKDQLIRNLVNPEIGLHILNCARQIKTTPIQIGLFQ